MSRDKNYQRLLNSPRWREVKTQVWRRANGLCERCIREGKAAGVPDGYITPGVDCHHIKPVESGRTVMEMEQLCYNPANIELLCVQCHIKTHAEQRSHCREKVAENKARARQRFMELNDPNYKSEDNDIQTEIHERPVWETGADRTLEAQAQANAEGNSDNPHEMG